MPCWELVQLEDVNAKTSCCLAAYRVVYDICMSWKNQQIGVDSLEPEFEFQFCFTDECHIALNHAAQKRECAG